MAPTDGLNVPTPTPSGLSNATAALGNSGAYGDPAWHGGLNVASVDLIAMLVSDAGLSAIEPQWWNASPLGCLLLGSQPRGGWQIMQRAVQWGADIPANCFGVTCNPNILYQYFACSIRNRLEVWKSSRFESPTRIRQNTPIHSPSDGPRAIVTGRTMNTQAGSSEEISTMEIQISSFNRKQMAEAVSKEEASTPPKSLEKHVDSASWRLWARRKPDKMPEFSKKWQVFDVNNRRPFSIPRPTKLVDGSRGGQAFMCELLRPRDNTVYTIEEQARMQFLSVLLVATSLIKDEHSEEWQEILREDFQLNTHLGKVFQRLFLGLVLANIIVVCFIVSVCYALWVRNIYDKAIPYAIQLCSLASWAYGAIGLLMLGGNPRVKMSFEDGIPGHIEARLVEKVQVRGHESLHIQELDPAGDLELHFGYQQGSVFTGDSSSCLVPGHIVKRVCALKLVITRPPEWYVGIVWFALYLCISIMLQIAGTKVAQIGSQIMSVFILILTSVFRGQGISGPESRMIPSWKAWPGAKYGAALVGKTQSRAQAGV
ncbi:hypothetical protein BCR34DRAFT_605919 [Clohesyomyces aquaticus]|uniref:Uncharacterized protein n=1 Tax=Clohesyomyces aquaticus TaxID=1231657 RepID=A0A1Y1YTQ9_9PLEO|nr:hypothetical protein BCR34DRAFT_605919 [Clohesyomyces aquaticus]